MQKIVERNIEIYTDGSSRGNPGAGGYGILIRIYKNDNKYDDYTYSAGFKDVTNNQMELKAIIVALEKLDILLNEISKDIFNYNNKFNTNNIVNYKITLYSDSQYCIKGINEWLNGWIKKNWKNAAKKPVKNKELWLDYLNNIDKIKSYDINIENKEFNTINIEQINFEWVKAHNGHPENELVDSLAYEEASKLL